MIRTNDIITVSGVSGYIDESGTAQLNLEHVARGLGFVTIVSGTEYVRWNRVADYLEEFGFLPHVAKEELTAAQIRAMLPEFIPENIFYRLAFKANNKTAVDFQQRVADEILPAIRKTGTYSARPMTTIQMLAAQAQAMADLEQKVTTTSNRLDGAVEALAAPTPKDWQTETGNRIKRICKENGLSYLDTFGKLYEELEDQAHVNLDARVRNLRTRLKRQGHTSREYNSISKLCTISNDPTLKLAFDGIARRFAAKYAAVSEK